MVTLVIADDLTGAAEIAGTAHRLGAKVRLTTSPERLTAEDEVVVVATDTRSMNRSEALDYTRNLVAQIASLEGREWVGRLFKKTDSVLRGHVVEELEALFALGYERALLLPANPSKGRVIRRRIYSIEGRPLRRTNFRNDPEFPAWSSDVVKLLGERVRYVTPRTRGGLKAGISIGEVTSLEDVACHIARHDGEQTILAGGADAFRALLEKQGFGEVSTAEFGGLGKRKTLLILGSTMRHNLDEEPLFRRCRVARSPMPDSVFAGESCEGWIEEACQKFAEAEVLVLNIAQPITREGNKALLLRHQMATTAEQIIHRAKPQEVVIEGGATAYTLLDRLAWHSLAIADEIAPGVVRLRHAESGTHLTFKPGSYPWGACFK